MRLQNAARSTDGVALAVVDVVDVAVELGETPSPELVLSSQAVAETQIANSETINLERGGMAKPNKSTSISSTASSTSHPLAEELASPAAW